ncbi:MAG: hypothetical protein KJ955_06325, partial [Nanoarchaeota archaeon]|nr:hypothetical protein [Nanoarchaeota archaeon]
MKKPAMPEMKQMRKFCSFIIEQRGGKPFSSQKEFEKFMVEAMDSGKMPLPNGAGKEGAEELIEKAREASGDRRVELAMKAIDLWKDCADAYVILAG